MRRLIALAILALPLASCAHRGHEPAATPGAPAAASAVAPAPVARMGPPPAPPAQAQHAPLWLTRGAVIDGHTGRPLENAALLVMARRDTTAARPTQPSIATGADGRFTLDFAAPGDYQVKIAALGYRTKQVLLHVTAAGDVPYRVYRLSPLSASQDPPASATPNP